MYQSKKCISNDGFRQLKSDLILFLQRRNNVYCKAIKRSVSLSKLPDAIVGRGKDAKRRLQSFFVALDILRHESVYLQATIKGYNCYEIRGYDCNGAVVIIHLREELVNKDRILFFVSCATQ